MKILILFSVLLFAISELATAQTDRIPDERVDPDAMVTLDDDLNFREAISILNEYSIEADGREIITEVEIDEPIGIEIPLMHWYRALEYITGFHELEILSREDHHQIVTREEADPETEPEEDDRFMVGDRVITRETREIDISATFFQGNSELIREMGVDWSTLSSDGRVQVDHFGASEVLESQLEVDVDASDLADGWNIQALFSAFESSGQGEIISSPNIRVMDGEEGRVQVGEDFSIRRQDFAGNVIDEFFSTGTILEVTPVVIEEEGYEDPFIYMNIEAERSTALPDEVSAVVTVQEADTDVLMLSGEATAIAGLYETEETQTRRGIPFLKDLPGWFFGLRYVFGYNAVEYSTEELVVVIQAEIVPSLEERLQDLQIDKRHELERELQRMRQEADVDIDTGVDVDTDEIPDD